MRELKRSESSLTKQLDLFRLFALVVVGCVLTSAGAVAVGLIIPRWDVLKIWHKVTVYVPPGAPAKALAESAPRTSDVTTVSAVGTAPQSVELIVRTDTPLQAVDAPTTSALAPMPTARLQDTESNPDSDRVPDSNVPAPTTAVAVEPRDLKQSPQLNSEIGPESRELDSPAAMSGLDSASLASPPQDTPPKPQVTTESHAWRATPSRGSHSMQSAQNSPPSALAPKQRPYSRPPANQRMWYK